MRYHDDEWGVPQHDDVRLFERLCLEAFQSGLSWLTILRKRDGVPQRRSPASTPSVVAAFDDADVQRLMADTGIVRNRAKVEAAIANARATLELPRRAGRAALVLRARPADRPRPMSFGRRPGDHAGVRRRWPRSCARGFRFVGPTTAYALMQACGMVDDHLVRVLAGGPGQPVR